MSQLQKVIIMGLLLGTSFPISKFAIAALGVWPFRLISSLSALLGLLVMFRREVRQFLSSTMDFRGIRTLVMLAVPNIFLVPTLNNFALSLTSASNAVILVYMMPALLSVIQMVAARRARIDSICAALLSVGGIALLLKSTVIGAGEIVILVSATVWAFGTFFAGRVGLQFPPAITTTVQYMTSFTLVVICFMLMPGERTGAITAPPSTLVAAIGLAIYVGFIANAIVFHFWFTLIREKGAEFVAYSSLISLVVGTLISVIVLSEPASSTLLASLLLIVASVYIVQCRKQPARAPLPVAARVLEDGAH